MLVDATASAFQLFPVVVETLWADTATPPQFDTISYRCPAAWPAGKRMMLVFFMLSFIHIKGCCGVMLVFVVVGGVGVVVCWVVVGVVIGVVGFVVV
jgi:hypothetical protein